MKRLLLGFLCFGAMGLLTLSSCQKAPELTITSPASVELSADGSNGTITFTANRGWTASSSDSWVTVSPSSGEASDKPVTVTVRCNANTTYDDRTATVTIRMEELSQTISVRQPANLGIIVPTQAFVLTSEGRTIDVEVQANVQYTVDISVDWIRQPGTKGLSTTQYSFIIAENTTYDDREGKITIKSQNSSVQDQVITVRQAQKDALIIKDTSLDMPYGGGEIEVKVEANVEFDVKPNVDWIHYVETKALSNSTIRLTVDENPSYEKRSGKIEVNQKNGELSHTITVNQAQRIAVTSVELNKTSLRINVGDSETLIAIVKPDNATDKTITWTSSDEAIATVDETGKVTAIKEGTATITAKAGEKTAECKVTVYVAVTSVELNITALSLIEGESETLIATVKPDNATDKTVTWSSSDEKIATVKDGKVTAVKVGEATITAKAGEKSAECKVTVSPVPVSSVTLDKTSLELEIGQTATLVATVKPDNAADKTVTWSSSDTKIATVDANGEVSAIDVGDVTITAKAGDKTAECKVTVKRVPVSSVSLDMTTLELFVGRTAILTATVKPDNATDKTVTWTSSNSAVASVDNDGKVTAIVKGDAVITATANDGSGVFASCAVGVKDSYTAVAGEAVDLGLSVKWSSMNLGATTPTGYGDYFAWGETEPKDNYSWETYKWCNGSLSTLTKYNVNSNYGTVDNKTELKDYDYEDDAARQALGGKWRIPSDAEWTELKNKCKWEWTTQNDVTGYLVTSKLNGNSIFLPAGSSWSGTGVTKEYLGTSGDYWSSTIISDASYYARCIDFYPRYIYRYENARYLGFSVRPVTE